MAKEIPPEVERINKQLIDHFGIDTATGQPMYRVVWSDDQFEHRYDTYDDYTSSGIFIRSVTETRYVPKYSQWIPHAWVLENLVAVPYINELQLRSMKCSYEPLFPFMDANDNPLPPKWEAAKFAIDCVNAVKGKKSLRHYTDGITKENHQEMYKQRIDELENQLFGDESGLKGTTIDSGSSIIVPNMEKVK